MALCLPKLLPPQNPERFPFFPTKALMTDFPLPQAPHPHLEYAYFVCGAKAVLYRSQNPVT